jgi:hypothetical protein
MNHWVNWLATVLGAGAALMTGMIGAWHSLPVLTLGLRCAVTGFLVFAFVRAGGEFAGRNLLRGLAEHELKHDGHEREKRLRPEPPSQPDRNDGQPHARPAPEPRRGARSQTEERMHDAGDEKSSHRQAA